MLSLLLHCREQRDWPVGGHLDGLLYPTWLPIIFNLEISEVRDEGWSVEQVRRVKCKIRSEAIRG